MNILDKIIEQKRTEIQKRKSEISIQELMNSEFFGKSAISMKKSLKEKSGIIAEFKRKSPSKGIINHHSEVLSVLKNYEKFGARAVSILTDKPFFGGNLEDISNVRKVISIPILRKDFMIDEYQFYEAKSIGSDVILLIAANLSVSQVQEFTLLSHQMGLEVLLEIHNENELKHINSDVDFVGINNRNLKDFKVNLEHSINLKNQLPKDILKIAESGIYNIEDFNYLKENGFDGFLMGEYFMKSGNPGKTFEEFVKQF